MLTVRGHMLATVSTASLPFENEADAVEVLSAFKADQHMVAAALYNKDGRLFATYPAKVPRDSLPAAPQPDGYRFEGGLVIGFQPVAEGGSHRLGPVYLPPGLGALPNALRLSAATADAGRRG